MRASTPYPFGRRVLAAPQRRRPGLTLLEVILVLSVLVVVAGLSWPLISRAYEAQRLRSAADLIRSRLTHARVEAIDTAASCHFRYEIGGRQFEISDDPCESSSTDESTDGTTDSSLSPEWRRGELPEGVAFTSPNGSPNLLGDGQWASVDFEPDGTCESATLRLRRENGVCIDISLRGVTGVVTVSDMFVEGGSQ